MSKASKAGSPGTPVLPEDHPKGASSPTPSPDTPTGAASALTDGAALAKAIAAHERGLPEDDLEEHRRVILENREGLRHVVETATGRRGVQVSGEGHHVGVRWVKPPGRVAVLWDDRGGPFWADPGGLSPA